MTIFACTQTGDTDPTPTNSPNGNGGTPDDPGSGTNGGDISVPHLPLPDPVTYMAADAGIFGSLSVQGDGSVGRFEQRNADDKLEFTIEIEQEGFYKLEFAIRTHSGFKENNLWVNGNPAGAVSADSNSYDPAAVDRVFFEAGTHTVAITASWGWITVQSLTVIAEAPLADTFFDVPATLVNPNADENALRLMSFLADHYGEVSLAGQQSQGDWRRDHGLFGGEAKLVYEITGKRPAVIGLDFIDYSLSRVERGAPSVYETAAAIEAWENNAIVTFCWHWNAPSPYIDGTWWSAFYTEHSQRGFFKKIMDGDDPEGYQLLIDDIDAISEQLKILRDAGVPILWRPLHEASGGWFWWGTDRESYLKLWKVMFERMNNHHNLTNLIWVWNGQHKDWYPGDEYLDIIGEDVYAANRDYSSQSARFFEAVAYTDAPKMVVLSENGVVFDPAVAKRDGAMWGYWCVWNGEFVNNEDRTEYSKLKEFYASPYAMTHEDLPDLKTYPIR